MMRDDKTFLNDKTFDKVSPYLTGLCVYYANILDFGIFNVKRTVSIQRQK